MEVKAKCEVWGMVVVVYVWGVCVYIHVHVQVQYILSALYFETESLT